MVFQAGSPDLSVNAAAATGRWVAAMRALSGKGRSAAKASWNLSGSIENSAGGLVAFPGRILKFQKGRAEHAVLRRPLDITEALALVRREGGHVDEADDVPGPRGGVGDDGTP
jgi:hypothetical protein